MTGPLNMFFGNTPHRDFLSDVANFKGQSRDEVLKLIDLTIKWAITGDIDDQFDRWAVDLQEADANKKRAAVRVILFVARKFSSCDISTSEVKQDFNKLGIPEEYTDNIFSSVQQSTEFKTRSLEKERPYENVITDVDWRIDRRYYCDGTDQLVALVEIAYRCKGESETLCLDMSLSSLRRLISALKRVEEDLCRK